MKVIAESNALQENIMTKENRVSLWLGYFSNEEDFYEYTDDSYDEDGNYSPSQFERDYEIEGIEKDFVEKVYLEHPCQELEELLEDFTDSEEIIPQFRDLLKNRMLCKYNCIILMYNYEYEGEEVSSKMEYIGTADYQYREEDFSAEFTSIEEERKNDPEISAEDRSKYMDE